MQYVLAPDVQLPTTMVAEWRNEQMVTSWTKSLFADKRVILIGVPAPFSPICSRLHMRGFIEQAPSLLASGFDLIACIAGTDPWVMAQWKQAIDPNGPIRFLSDGNLEFGETCSLTISEPDYFIGTRLRQFSLIAVDNMVERISVEPGVEVTCTAIQHLRA